MSSMLWKNTRTSKCLAGSIRRTMPVEFADGTLPIIYSGLYLRAFKTKFFPHKL